MAIYVAQNNAVLLKKDRSVAELYKGDKRLFGYNGNAIGEAIRINDINPVKHRIKLELTSDVPTDFSSVKLTVCGRNILPVPAWSTLTNGGITYIRNSDGTIVLNGRTDGVNHATLSLNTSGNTDLSFLKPNTDYSLSLEGIDVNLCLETKTSNGASKYYSYGGARFSDDETPYRIFFQIRNTDNRVFENVTVKAQIELGNKATAIETAERENITVAKDGKCNSIISRSPTTSLFTDTAGVKINCKYVKN